MLLKFCEHTVYVTQLHKKSTSQSLLANYCMRPLLGGGLHQQQTGSVLKQYFAAACVMDCTHHSKLLTE